MKSMILAVFVVCSVSLAQAKLDCKYFVTGMEVRGAAQLLRFAVVRSAYLANIDCARRCPQVGAPHQQQQSRRRAACKSAVMAARRCATTSEVQSTCGEPSVSDSRTLSRNSVFKIKTTYRA